MINNKEKILMKNNILVQAKYNLTLVENRIFTLLLYKFQKK
ncbi:RepB family plasmid replication initiator protein [Clostridium haemolyticum]|nr:RepB family plasmid replication initiator protein [Clostridium haemolyticum]